MPLDRASKNEEDLTADEMHSYVRTKVNTAGTSNQQNVCVNFSWYCFQQHTMNSFMVIFFNTQTSAFFVGLGQAGGGML